MRSTYMRINTSGRLLLTLVDHNVLPATDKALDRSVVEIVDHHHNERPEDEDGRCDQLIELVGSCCTLVADKILHKAPELLDEQLAMLLFGTIVLDTVNFSESARKVTVKDRDVAARLQARLPGADTDVLFQQLQAAKCDTSALSNIDLLRKDLKTAANEGVSIAVSSVPMSATAFLSRSAVQADMARFCDTNSYDVIVVMDSRPVPDLKAIAVFSQNDCYRVQMCDLVTRAALPRRQTEVLPSATLLQQCQPGTTRKQMLPCIRAFLLTDASATPASPVDDSLETPRGADDSRDDGYVASSPPATRIDNPPLRLPDEEDVMHNFNALDDGLPHPVAMETDVGAETDDADALEAPRCATPRNSYADEHARSFPAAEPPHLPSFHSRDMVNKIAAKKEAMSQDDDTLLLQPEARNFPYTPPSSFADGEAADAAAGHEELTRSVLRRVLEKASSLEELTAGQREVEEEEEEDEEPGQDPMCLGEDEAEEKDSGARERATAEKSREEGGAEEERESGTEERKLARVIAHTAIHEALERFEAVDAATRVSSREQQRYRGDDDDPAVATMTQRFFDDDPTIACTSQEAPVDGLKVAGAAAGWRDRTGGSTDSSVTDGRTDSSDAVETPEDLHPKRSKDDVNKVLKQGRFLDEAEFTMEPARFPNDPSNMRQVIKASIESAENMKHIVTQDEWQDDNYPSSLPEDGSADVKPERPGNLSERKRVPVHPLLLEEEDEDSDAFLQQQRRLDSNIVDNDNGNGATTPGEHVDDGGHLDELEWENDTPVTSPSSEHLPELSASEEYRESRSWKRVVVGGKQQTIDMKVIEPYKKVLSHGGYYGEGLKAIIVFAACYLPDRSRNDYEYVMDNLFLYVINTLEQLVAEDYMLVYLHSGSVGNNMPRFSWLKRCYQMIDRRYDYDDPRCYRVGTMMPLRKNLKALYLVHPTFWLKTIVIMCRPFISHKFWNKLKFIYTLKQLDENIPMDYVYVPDQVKRYDMAKTAA
ncbi:PREDICTED: uncharacterized protein LOC106821494 [Priapulus caudatus]|uniref:Uncharacterized protein LOC106821494 n=1 Tax=Priapulus caudatus TaxID=37621 RepID=A0ABM1FBJ6_PRICU|nr:PREDICTED: uncharacterized protein LOC106821494 [Priapulus caudatus]